MHARARAQEEDAATAGGFIDSEATLLMIASQGGFFPERGRSWVIATGKREKKKKSQGTMTIRPPTA